MVFIKKIKYLEEQGTCLVNKLDISQDKQTLALISIENQIIYLKTTEIHLYFT